MRRDAQQLPRAEEDHAIHPVSRWPRCWRSASSALADRSGDWAMAIITSIDVLPRPDIAELQQDLKTELSQRMLGGTPVLPMSAEDILAFVMAGTVNLMHGYVTQALKENNPATMRRDNHRRDARGEPARGDARERLRRALTRTPGCADREIHDASSARAAANTSRPGGGVHRRCSTRAAAPWCGFLGRAGRSGIQFRPSAAHHHDDLSGNRHGGCSSSALA